MSRVVGMPRLALAVVMGAVAALGVTGCGAGVESTGSDGEASVTITHARGETTVPDVPVRIVALGNQWLDAALALGVEPVGYLDNIAAYSGSRPRWEPASLDNAKSVTNRELVEQVAELGPDLILADPFIADQKNYEDLSGIAPTIPALSEAAAAPWRDQITTLASVLEKQEVAARVIATIDERVAGMTRTYPGLSGKTFASTWLYTKSQLMVLNDPNDGSAELFARLGLRIPPALIEMPDASGRVSLSTERLDVLQVDLLLVAAAAGLEDDYRRLPGYQDLPSVRRGAVVWFDNQEISAVNQPSPLSIPYILDKIEPVLAAVAR